MTSPRPDPDACAMAGCRADAQVICLRCRGRFCRLHADHARHSGAGAHPSGR